MKPMRTTEKQRASSKAKYYANKAARLCVCCSSPLEHTDGVKCVICAEQNLAAALRRQARNPEKYNKRKREALRRNYQRNVEARRAHMREVRLDKKLRGECYDCAQPAADDGVRCEYHRAKSRRYGIAYWRRNHKDYKPRKQPAPLPPRERKERTAKTIEINRARDAAKTYVPFDDPDGYRIRILRALFWDDWLNSMEIFDRAGIDSDYRSTERNTAAQALARLVKTGMAESRAGTGAAGFGGRWNDYRITQAGREEVKRLRDTRRAA